MAEDSKRSPATPPFAYKGAARPLARKHASDGDAAGVREERRPKGLHTRPDLFGSSAVMQKPDEPTSDSAEDAAQEAASAERRETNSPEPAETIRRTDPADETDAEMAPSSAPPPAGNLLDHPVRIPESISFEDWPGGSDPVPEDGARSSNVGGSADVPASRHQGSGSGNRTESPMGRTTLEGNGTHRGKGGMEETVSAKPDEPAKGPAAVPPAASAASAPASVPEFIPEPDEPAGRFGALLSRLEEEDLLERLRDYRWPIALGAVSCAALLVAGLVGGVLPGSNDGPKLAQNLEAPPAGHSLAPSSNSAASGESEPADLSMMPAGTEYGPDQPTEALSERPVSAAGLETAGTSQLAALPEAGSPSALDGGREPVVDFMRIDPDGKAVVAGRAAPGTELIVLDNGKPLGTVTVDIYGLWTFVSERPLADGRHEIGLRVKRQGSEVSDPVLVTETGPAVPGVPEAPAELADAASSEASDATLPASEQLAAAEPAAAVQSDETSPSSTDATSSAASASDTPAADEQPAQAEPAAADVGTDQPAEPDSSTDTASTADTVPSAATQTDGQSDSAAQAVASAPAPTPKPEAPAAVQTAAIPDAGDFVIQLASFKNPDTAVREQALVQERFPDLLSGHKLFVQEVDLAEQGTFYRVRLGPFSSLDAARATCARFQERDRDCLAMAR